MNMKLASAVLAAFMASICSAAPVADYDLAKRQNAAGTSFISNGLLYIITDVVIVETVTISSGSSAVTTEAATTAAPGTTAAAATTAASLASVNSTAAPSSINPTALLSAILPSTYGLESTTTITVIATQYESSGAPTTTAPATTPASTASATTEAPAATSAPAATVTQSSQTATSATAPAQQTNVQSGGSGTSSLTADIVLKVATNSGSCSGATYASECITADAIAPAVANSYAKYGITSPGAQAAVLSLMTFESGGFQYDMKHFPPTPGQGTRNMMSSNFVSEYATALKGASAVQGLSAADVLNLVIDNNEDSCGSGAWFLATKCPSVLSQFATDPEGAWVAYHGSGCIGTTLTDARTAIWTLAKAAFGGIS